MQRVRRTFECLGIRSPEWGRGSRKSEQSEGRDAGPAALKVGVVAGVRCEVCDRCCLLGVSEIGREDRGKEVYDGGGRAEVLVRLCCVDDRSCAIG